MEQNKCKITDKSNSSFTNRKIDGNQDISCNEAFLQNMRFNKANYEQKMDYCKSGGSQKMSHCKAVVNQFINHCVAGNNQEFSDCRAGNNQYITGCKASNTQYFNHCEAGEEQYINYIKSGLNDNRYEKENAFIEKLTREMNEELTMIHLIRLAMKGYNNGTNT